MVDYKTKQEMNALSQEVFGSSSRWNKLVQNGYTEVETEEFQEYVPNETDPNGEGTTRTASRPVKNEKGLTKIVQRRFTVETMRDYMLERKAKLDEFRAMIAAKQVEAQAKKENDRLAKLVHEELSGTAVK